MASASPSAAPAATAPPAEPVYAKLITLKYKFPPPRPVEAVSDPTPEDEYKMHLHAQEEKSRHAQEEAKTAREEAGKEASVLGKVSLFSKAVATTLGDGLEKAHSSVESGARNQVESRMKAQFVESFPKLAATSELRGSYGCKAMHSGQKIDGTLFVSTTHVAFASKVGVREEIPYPEISSVQPSLALPTSRAGDGKEDSPPYIMPVPDTNVLGDCIQIFANTGALYQFLLFDDRVINAAKHTTSSISGSAYERAYNWLDHMWRSATPVPADIEYY